MKFSGSNTIFQCHLSYCVTSWPPVQLSNLYSLYHQALKVLDRQPNTHHHCYCIRHHNLLSWDNLIKFTDGCLVYKILHGLAPPPFSAFIKQKTTDDRETRSEARGGCIISMRRTAFVQPILFCESSSHIQQPTRIRDTYCSFRLNLK